jgi:hypothetical protein
VAALGEYARQLRPFGPALGLRRTKAQSPVPESVRGSPDMSYASPTAQLDDAHSSSQKLHLPHRSSALHDCRQLWKKDFLVSKVITADYGDELGIPPDLVHFCLAMIDDFTDISTIPDELAGDCVHRQQNLFSYFYRFDHVFSHAAAVQNELLFLESGYASDEHI